MTERKKVLNGINLKYTIVLYANHTDNTYNNVTTAINTKSIEVLYRGEKCKTPIKQL